MTSESGPRHSSPEHNPADQPLRRARADMLDLSIAADPVTRQYQLAQAKLGLGQARDMIAFGQISPVAARDLVASAHELASLAARNRDLSFRPVLADLKKLVYGRDDVEPQIPTTKIGPTDPPGHDSRRDF